MSLVLGYVSKECAVIMSDGRAGVNGCFSEHYNKTLKINDNIILESSLIDASINGNSFVSRLDFV